MKIEQKCCNCEYFVDQKCANLSSKSYEIIYENDEKIEVIINDFSIFKDVKAKIPIKKKQFSLNITLGDSYMCKGCEFAMSCNVGNCVCSILSSKYLQANFRANSKLKNIIINVGKNFLIKHAGAKILKKIQSLGNSNYISEVKCQPDTILLAKEIFFNPNPSALFLKSKIFGILDNELKNLENSTFVNITEIERKMLENAYKIIEKNYANPPSIKELSYKIGLNESKLKTLFKAFFGSTIHSISTSIRMTKAKEMIKNGESLQSISNTLGFSATSNFSFAFKKHFGFAPSRLKE